MVIYKACSVRTAQVECSFRTLLSIQLALKCSLSFLLVVIVLLSNTIQPSFAEWAPHWVIRGSDILPAQRQVFTEPGGGNYLLPFGLSQMDNGEVAFMSSWHNGTGEVPVISFSSDGGNSWTPWQQTPYPGLATLDRPYQLTYLGEGNLSYTEAVSGGGVAYFSSDYGRNWPESKLVGSPPNLNVGGWWNEGTHWVDFDSNEMATRVHGLGFSYRPGSPGWPSDGGIGFYRYSDDGGRTWQGAVEPPQWQYTDLDSNGQPVPRGVSEGSIIRADNGDLVAALRTDMPAIYLDKSFDDSLEGTAISISSDNGATWSSMNHLYDAGRHHANLQKLPNGDLILNLIVRDDIRGNISGFSSDLTTISRGADALISHDNGQTWNLTERFTLDAFDYLSPSQWYDGKTGHVGSTVLDDGSVLTAYGNYLADNGKQAAVLVKWDPSATPLPANSNFWDEDASGDWNLASNWSFATIPNANDATAIFSSGNASARTVFTDSSVLVKSVQFYSSNRYVVAGVGVVNLQADAGNATIVVNQGSHEFQVAVDLNSETEVEVASNASLAFNNILSLNGNNLIKTGDGAMQINSTLNTGGGTVSTIAGALFGGGTLQGNFVNSGATLSPGNSPGKFTIAGNYTQKSGATLSIEIAGLSQGNEYDLLEVVNTMSVNGGTLEVSLLDGFLPSNGDVFDVLNFGSIRGAGFESLRLPSLLDGLSWDVSQILVDGTLRVTAVPEPSTPLLVLLGLLCVWSRVRVLGKNAGSP